MSEINKNSILLSYQGPLRMAETNPNSVVIAGGSASIPTGRLTTVESGQRAAPHYDGVGVDFTRTPETMWPTGPGIQIVSQPPETDDSTGCCCECCCSEEPAPPPTLREPADEKCPCPTKPPSIGIFIEGVDPIGMNMNTFPPTPLPLPVNSAMQYLCSHYPGESHYFRSYRFPGTADAEAEAIAEYVRRRACQLTTTYASPGSDDRHLVPCPIPVDLFGFSRGGATAIRVAQLLNRPFACKHCKVADTFPFELIRFLGVLDPTMNSMELVDPLGLRPSHEWTAEIPSNVEHYFAAYSDPNKFRWATRYATAQMMPRATTFEDTYVSYDHSGIGDHAIEKEILGHAPTFVVKEDDLTLPLFFLTDEFSRRCAPQQFAPKDEPNLDHQCATREDWSKLSVEEER